MDKEFRDFLHAPDPKPDRRASRRPKVENIEPAAPSSEPASAQVVRRGHNSFGWTVGILLLVGVALGSWIGSFYVFAHPEDPRCYSVLQTLHKLDPLKRFEVTAAPPGKFYSARELYDVFLTSGPAAVEQRNEQLMHDYLRNYHDTKTLVPYLAGRFTTLGVYELKGSDEFPAGVVAVAQSADCPQVFIEHIYSTQPANIPKVRQMLAVNPEIMLAKKFDLASVIHAEKRDDGTVVFTVVPLGYGAYAFKQGISSTFRLDPPRALNLEAGLPVVKPAAMAEAEKMFAQYRKSKGLLAKIKTPTPAETPAADKKAVAYGWIAVPNAKVPMPTPVAAPEPAQGPAPTISQTPEPPEETVATTTPQSDDRLQQQKAEAAPENVNNVGTTANKHRPVAMSDAAATSEAAPSTPLPVVESPQISTEAPVVQIEPAQPSRNTVSPTLPMPTPGAVAKTTAAAPQRVAAQPSPVVPAQPAAPQPKAPKLIAKTPPAPAQSQSSTLAAPTPTVGRPIAHLTPSPSLTHIITAMHTPAPAPSMAKTQPPAYVAATPVPTRPIAAATPALNPYYTPQAPVAYATPPTRQYPATNSTGVKLEPFLASQAPQTAQPRSSEPARAASWRTYAPGQMPRGKLVDWELTQELAATGIAGDRYYLRGKYVVTASSDNRIVLRPQGYGGDTVQSVRVVVEFPAGAQLPAEGAAVARGESRPFQITGVRRGDDGQINVFAREVTSSWSSTSNTTELLRNYHSQRQRLANLYYSQQ